MEVPGHNLIAYFEMKQTRYYLRYKVSSLSITFGLSQHSFQETETDIDIFRNIKCFKYFLQLYSVLLADPFKM